VISPLDGEDKYEEKPAIIFISIDIINNSNQNCATTSRSLLIANSYNPQNNITTLTALPYGNIDIPGRWAKTGYVGSSGQHFFKNSDLTVIAVGKLPQTKIPSYQKSKTNYENVYAFYKWDSEYFKNKKGYEVREIKNDEDNCFVLWDIEKGETRYIFIFGLKNGMFYNFLVQSGNWPEDKIHNFLIDLFLNN
jgi:hypothetical protein